MRGAGSCPFYIKDKFYAKKILCCFTTAFFDAVVFTGNNSG